MHGLPFRPGLDGHQRMAEKTARNAARVVRRSHQLDAVLRIVLFDRAFAASAGVDLRLDDGEFPAEFVERIGNRSRSVGHDASRNGDAGLRENLLGLIFVDLHGS